MREWRENRQKQEQEQDPSLSQSNTENTNGVVDGDLILDAVIKARHFESAFSRVRPSVTLQDRKRFDTNRFFTCCLVYLISMVIKLFVMISSDTSECTIISSKEWEPFKH